MNLKKLYQWMRSVEILAVLVTLFVGINDRVFLVEGCIYVVLPLIIIIFVGLLGRLCYQLVSKHTVSRYVATQLCIQCIFLIPVICFALWLFYILTSGNAFPGFM